MNFTVRIRILRFVLLFSLGPKKLAVLYGNCYKKESCIYWDPLGSIPLWQTVKGVLKIFYNRISCGSSNGWYKDEKTYKNNAIPLSPIFDANILNSFVGIVFLEIILTWLQWLLMQPYIGQTLFCSKGILWEIDHRWHHYNPSEMLRNNHRIMFSYCPCCECRQYNVIC